MSDAPALDPEMLERLRRGVPLVLAPTGRFRFEGADVTHTRVEMALRTGLDVTEAGEAVVHLGAQWCYLTVEDCLLRGTAVQERDGGLWLRLDDGREVALPHHTLWEEPDRGLRASVPSARSGRPMSVRLTNAAQLQLSTWIEFDESTDQATLVYGGLRSPIPTTAPSS
ncbi:MAG: hypothetical protein AAGA54_07415 [Myxococcota bacterium]